MYKHILVATDGSELASRGLLHGVSLAQHLGADVTIVTVTESWTALEMASEVRLGHQSPTFDYERKAAASAQRILEHAEQICREHGTEAKTIHVPDHHPAEGILETASRNGCDVIVMASHGRRGLRQLLLGSQTSEVLAGSPIPVLVVR